MKKLATLALLTLGGPLAFAQATASATGTANAKIIVPVTITTIDGLTTNNRAPGVLDFGTIVPSGTAGTVSVNVASDLAVTRPPATGGATILGSSTFSGASFKVGGDGGATVSVAVPTTPVTISSGSNNMTVTSMQAGASTVTLSGSTGSLGSGDIVVGGTLNVGANQAAGSYTGSFTVTVSYN